MQRREETAAVKSALIDAGYHGVKVRHGTRSAYDWLRIYVSDTFTYGPNGSYRNILRIAASVTGRSGEYDGKISIQRKRRCLAYEKKRKRR